MVERSDTTGSEIKLIAPWKGARKGRLTTPVMTIVGMQIFWHPAGVHLIWNLIPVVSLRSTTGYWLLSLQDRLLTNDVNGTEKCV